MAIQINDKVVIDLTDDGELKDYFSRKSAGEECSMEIKASLDEASSEQAVLSIRGIEVDEYSSDKTEDAPKKKDVKFKMKSGGEVEAEY